ncbi:aminopeptidase [[Clostridium] hylemonae]|uniref:aminopeptidase n=1 Tax=[Clostridium] hylemonae TaxID=89153 RepID=UPI001106DB70|nr:aminopeptidase [[Clostridium] hylemonae]
MQNELIQIAQKLLRDLYRMKQGELLVITADTLTDREVVEATEEAAGRLGIQWATLWIKAPGGVAVAADKEIPGKAVVSLLLQADAWAEYNKMWIYGSGAYSEIMKKNTSLRHMCLTGATGELLAHCIGNIRYDALQAFGLKLAEKIQNARCMRMTTEKGMDISFENIQGRPVLKELGDAGNPGTNMLPGQIAWTPLIESVNGTLVFDGALAPVCGVPSEPVRIKVVDGRVKEVAGGKEAEAYLKWLKSFEHPQMFGISHTGIGINPGALLSGDILQDQRVWGSVTWAFGSIGGNLVPPDGVPGPSHSDCVALGATLIIDGREFFHYGEVTDEEFKELARALTGR